MRANLGKQMGCVAVAGVAAVGVWMASFVVEAQTGRPDGVIAGTVISTNGPEAGVWVIAETDELETKFVKIVVTDDEGRFVLPELPDASYDVLVRGYGLVDSEKTRISSGQFGYRDAPTPASRPVDGPHPLPAGPAPAVVLLG